MSAPQDPPERLLLTIPELAAMTSLGRSTIYQLVAEGRIDIVHVGRAARVPYAEAVRFVQSLTVSGER